MFCEMECFHNEHRLNMGKFNLCRKEVAGQESWENTTTYETFSAVRKRDIIV